MSCSQSVVWRRTAAWVGGVAAGVLLGGCGGGGSSAPPAVPESAVAPNVAQAPSTASWRAPVLIMPRPVLEDPTRMSMVFSIVGREVDRNGDALVVWRKRVVQAAPGEPEGDQPFTVTLGWLRYTAATDQWSPPQTLWTGANREDVSVERVRLVMGEAGHALLVWSSALADTGADSRPGRLYGARFVPDALQWRAPEPLPPVAADPRADVQSWTLVPAGDDGAALIWNSAAQPMISLLHLPDHSWRARQPLGHTLDTLPPGASPGPPQVAAAFNRRGDGIVQLRYGGARIAHSYAADTQRWIYSRLPDGVGQDLVVHGEGCAVSWEIGYGGVRPVLKVQLLPRGSSEWSAEVINELPRTERTFGFVDLAPVIDDKELLFSWKAKNPRDTVVHSVAPLDRVTGRLGAPQTVASLPSPDQPPSRLFSELLRLLPAPNGGLYALMSNCPNPSDNVQPASDCRVVDAHRPSASAPWSAPATVPLPLEVGLVGLMTDAQGQHRMWVRSQAEASSGPGSSGPAGLYASVYR
jgi:hypothetical protein